MITIILAGAAIVFLAFCCVVLITSHVIRLLRRENENPAPKRAQLPESANGNVISIKFDRIEDGGLWIREFSGNSLDLLDLLAHPAIAGPQSVARIPDPTVEVAPVVQELKGRESTTQERRATSGEAEPTSMPLITESDKVRTSTSASRKDKGSKDKDSKEKGVEQ